MKILTLTLWFFSFYAHSTSFFVKGNDKIGSFREAKKILPKIWGHSNKTFYCQCPYQNKKIDLKPCGVTIRKYLERKSRLEWEHVVPAHAFGKSLHSWRLGHENCKKWKKKNKNYKTYKGRKCAKKVSNEFRRMEADLYNIFPSVGAINAYRANFSFTDGIQILTPMFGACDLKIIDRKIEPRPEIKGNIARVYFYMNSAYPNRGIIGEQKLKLFEYWNKIDPVDREECLLAEKIREIQGNENPYISNFCQKF